MPTEQQPDRRRKSRVPHKSRVVISGLDADGFNFAEETETVMVSNNGAAFRTAYVLAIGQEICVRIVETNRSGQFQVVWLGTAGTVSEGKVGLEWVESKRFWDVDFPPEDWGDE